MVDSVPAIGEMGDLGCQAACEYEFSPILVIDCKNHIDYVPSYSSSYVKLQQTVKYKVYPVGYPNPEAKVLGRLPFHRQCSKLRAQPKLRNTTIPI